MPIFSVSTTALTLKLVHNIKTCTPLPIRGKLPKKSLFSLRYKCINIKTIKIGQRGYWDHVTPVQEAKAKAAGVEHDRLLNVSGKRNISSQHL